MSTPRTVQKILSVAEGESLRMLEALLVPEQRSFPRTVVKIEAPSVELMNAAKDRLSKAAVRFLFAGASKELAVLRNGQRTEGRLWDPHMNEGFSLRFTEHSNHFWLGACRQFAVIGDAGVSRNKKTLRGILPDEPEVQTDSGDWVFFHLAAQGLAKFGLGYDMQSNILRRLRQASPLYGLFVLDRDVVEGEILRNMKQLTRDNTIRIVECLEERLVSSWEIELSQLYAAQGTAEQLTQRWNTVTRVLRSFLDALNTAGRLDLSLSVLRTMLALQKKTFAAGATMVRSRVASQAGVKNVQQRDMVVSAIASCMSLATWVYQQRDLLAAQRYGDERYQEAQLFVRRVDTFSSSRVEIDTLVRALSGTIG